MPGQLDFPRMRRAACLPEGDEIELADADLGSWLGERVAAEFPAMGFDQAGFTKLLEDPLDEFQGQPIRLGELRSGNDGPPNLSGNAEVDGGAQGVFSFF